MISAEQTYLFCHALLRDAAYELHLPETRARLHVLAVELLEVVFAGQAAGALEIAGHCRAAGNLIPDPELAAREARHLDRGAAHAHRAYDHAACIAALQRLRDLTTGPEARAGVCTRLAAALDKVGRMGQAAELAMESARLTTDLEKRAQALTRATWFYASAGCDAESQAAFGELEELARVTPEPRLIWHAASARALVKYFANDFGAAAEAAGEALTLGEAAGVPEGELMSDMTNLATLRRQCGDLPGAEAQGLAALEVCKRAGALEMQALAWNILADVSRRQGDLPLTEERMRAGLKAALQASSPLRCAQARYHLGMLLLRTGRCDQARAELLAALPGYAEQGRAVVASHIQLCLVRAYIWQNRLPDAQRQIQAMQEHGAPDGSGRVLPAIAQAMAELARQDWNAALGALAHVHTPALKEEAALAALCRTRALAGRGRMDEALAQSEIAINVETLELDTPTDGWIANCWHAWLLHKNGQSMQAKQQAKAAHELAHALAIGRTFPAPENTEAWSLLDQIP